MFLKRDAVGSVQQSPASALCLGCPECGNEQCLHLLVPHQSFEAASTRWQYLKQKVYN